MSTPDTTDTPTRLAILPDWAAGVTLSQAYGSAIQTAYAGPDQRQAKQELATYLMAYERGGLTEAEARRRIQAIRGEFRKPLTVPLWTDGIGLESAMTSATSALLESDPIIGEWETPLDLYFWTRALGGEFRTATGVVGRNLTMSGTGTLYPTGAFVFPCRTMVREPSEQALAPVDIQTGIESLKFRTL